MSSFLPRYALATVPRYTSYPPATQFGPAVDAAAYRRWLARIETGASLSLYLHIPFCQALCWYCGCHTTVPNRPDRILRYGATLQQEIALLRAAVPAEPAVSHVHFGGGTPNALPPELFRAIIEGLRQRFAFAPAAELALELDPRCLTDAQVEAFAATGITRASLGVQDIDPAVQSLINRHQPLAMVEAAVQRLRAAGIGAINVDLMYGLPGQSVEHVVRSAEAMAALAPDRLAVFGYAHVPWFKKHQRAIDEARLPSPEERFEQAAAAAAALTAAGYVAIGLDHFAKPADPLAIAQAAGRLRRNFQGYTVDPAAALIGLGASSIGALPEGYAQNEPRLGHYETLVGEGQLPVVRGLVLSDDDRKRGQLIERLMCDLAVELGPLADDPIAQAELMARLAPLAVDGLIELDHGRLRVTATGRPYVRNIASSLDAYHSASATRHSRAV